MRSAATLGDHVNEALDDFPAIAPPPSHQVVADVLRRRIALGVYFPGRPLPSERQLAEVLGVGRATIRTAVRALSDEGLVVTKRGRWGGTTVTENGRQLRNVDRRDLRHDVTEVFEFRLLVEPSAAELAAQRGATSARRQLLALADEDPTSIAGYRAQDSRLHLGIAAMSGNRLLLSSLEAARADFFMWADAFYDTEWNPDLPLAHQSVAEHRAIVRAIVDGKPRAAKTLMREHLEAAGEKIGKIVAARRL
jgi:GntR family transcriptional regulator, transcriptional repressor for pyruvate dehydrogenase complex